MRALLWAGIFTAWSVLILTVGWTFLKGRLPADQYHQHLRSPEWAAVVARLEAKRRGRRCAACGVRDGLHTHHATYQGLGYEQTWQLVKVCGRDHQRIHTLSEWVFSSRTRGLWLTTGLVVGMGKAKRLGRRPRHATSATLKIPAAFRDGDVIFPADGHVYQRTGTDWQRLDP